MRNRPGESVGVVTLSRAQADLVETLVDEARLAHSEFDSHFAPESDERFFVKNLENVQGDERDHIVMSVGYGPSPESGQVYNRFGPINNDGGERRLNVAVSRARRSMTVVHSLRPEDITAKSDGARLLKRYLEFARSPDTAIEQNLTIDAAAEIDSPFEEAVRRALVARGHRVDVQVGVSGYRIDLAIQAEDREGYTLGIECDGATYHSAPAARDRDWLRQSVLEGLGWKIHRVWSRSWIQNPERELEAIEQALDEAVAQRIDDLSQVGQREPAAASGIEAEFEMDSDDADPAVAQQPHAYSIPDEAEVRLFDRYEVADLSLIPVGSELKNETSATLDRLVEEVVRVEEPVHLDAIIERIRVRYEADRIRGRTREELYHAIRAMCSAGALKLLEERSHAGQVSNTFLAIPKSAGLGRPRAPRDGAPSNHPSRRKIDHVSLVELKAGVLARAELLYGASRDDLVLDTARAFGFKRTGKHVKARIGEAVNQLVKDGKLVGDSDMLTIAD